MPTIKTIEDAPHARIRVHIAPIGFEEDRILLPVKKLRAEKVILISNELAYEKAKKFYDVVRKQLELANIDVELRRAPIFQLEQSMKLFSDIISEYKEEQLFINISSGSKIQALAGYISAMAAKAEGIQVTLYYVEPEKYTEDPPKNPISHGCKRILPLPIFPLLSPSKEIQYAISLLKVKPYSKLELAIGLAKQGYFSKDLLAGEETKPKNEKARVSLQNTVDSRIVQPLLREKYATTDKVGRRIMISLTNLGEEASHLYGDVSS